MTAESVRADVLDRLNGDADAALATFQNAIYWEGTPTEGPEEAVRMAIAALLLAAYEAGMARGRANKGA